MIGQPAQLLLFFIKRRDVAEQTDENRVLLHHVDFQTRGVAVFARQADVDGNLVFQRRQQHMRPQRVGNVFGQQGKDRPFADIGGGAVQHFDQGRRKRQDFSLPVESGHAFVNVFQNDSVEIVFFLFVGNVQPESFPNDGAAALPFRHGGTDEPPRFTRM